MKSKIRVFALLFAVLINVSSCSYIKNAETETETESDIITEQVETEQVFRDPLTAEQTDFDLSASRPIAIVIKNDRKASPQFGLSKAAILYETAVEGGMTRFVAVYSDVSFVDKVGPVIDSRDRFIDFAVNHNAVLVQAGADADGKTALENLKPDVLDAIKGEMKPGFYRDPSLVEERGYENSILTDANGIKARVREYGISLENDKKVLPYTADDDALTDKNITAYCSYLCIPFSVNMTVTYSYKTLTNKYVREQYDAPHTDAATGEQLAFTNIILMIDDGKTDFNTEKDTDNSRSGKGYYISGGVRINIKWNKDGTESPVGFYYEDGLTPLKVSTGNTYIAVLSSRIAEKTEYSK